MNEYLDIREYGYGRNAIYSGVRLEVNKIVYGIHVDVVNAKCCDNKWNNDSRTQPKSAAEKVSEK